MNKHGRFPPGKLILLVLLMVAVTACNGLPGSQSSPTEKPTPPVPAIPKETEIPPILEVTQPIVFTHGDTTAANGNYRTAFANPTRMVVIVTQLRLHQPSPTGIPNTGRSGSGVS